MRASKSLKLLLSMILAMVLVGMNAVHAESEEASEWTEEAEAQEETNFFEGLDVMEVTELAFKVVRLEAVAGNKTIADPHFKATFLFQNTSPYTIRNPATAIEIVDSKFNSVALTNVKLEGSLPPGHSKGVIVEFESLVEITAGQNVKKLKIDRSDVLYGERIDDKHAIETKGAYVFFGTKQLKVKVSDPYGYQHIPAKNLLEAAGFKYTWTAKTSTFTATKGKLKIEHKIGTRQLKVNGKIVKLDGGQTAFVNKTPMISVDVLMQISASFAVAKGVHYDSEILMISIADQDSIK